MSVLRIDAAEAFAPLLGNARYKGAWGGRGSGKSHFFAEMMLARCYSAPTRAACIREVQNSLRESVRQLLIDKIAALDLKHFFRPYESEIRAANGSLIVFKGMQSYNAETIKSLEGYDIAWVEEAQTLSARSLKMLRPTIRREGSELWFGWNPRHDTDPVDMFFRGGEAPPDSVCVSVSWRDNPWLPDVLRVEMEHDYRIDPEVAAHVWGGGYEIITEGSYYARLIAEAENEGRIGDFAHDPERLVDTAWDIGVDDYTAIWFFQTDGTRARAIDYYETSGDGAGQIVEAAIRGKPYRYGVHYLPHDVKVREWGAGAKSRVQTLLELGLDGEAGRGRLRVGAAQKVDERINAARRLLPVTEFNRETTGPGVRRLRSYRRRFNEALATYQGPLHDEASHGADAFGEYAVNSPLAVPKPAEPERSPFEPKAPTFEEMRARSRKRALMRRGL